jgi:hypothetical protein
MLLKDQTKINDKLWDDFMLDFSTMTRAMYTLVLDGGLLLDGASAVITVLLFDEAGDYMVKTAGCGFILYHCITSLMIMNMLIGVLFDVIMRVIEEDKQMAHIKVVEEKVLGILKTHTDKPDDGNVPSRKSRFKCMVSHEEFLTVLQDESNREALKELNINLLYMLQLTHLLFPHADSQASFEDVVALILTCRGQETATVDGLAGGFCYIAHELVTIHRGLNYTMEKVQHMSKAGIFSNGSSAKATNGTT